MFARLFRKKRKKKKKIEPHEEVQVSSNWRYNPIALPVIVIDKEPASPGETIKVLTKANTRYQQKQEARRQS